MTGFGEAHFQGDNVAISVELRTINNRYFKLTFRASDGYSALESEVESVVRQQVRRGTLQVSLRVDRARASDDFLVNLDVLENYRRQLTAVLDRWHSSSQVELGQLLSLPGVIVENPIMADDAQRDWPQIEKTLREALTNLTAMRREEGTAMQRDLAANCQEVRENLALVEQRAPRVSEAYRERLGERLSALLAEYQATLNPADLVREVGLFAERSDISEEIVRLRSHVEQFEAAMQLPESSGRKLEFLAQEMFRETNTIGSKANDVEISRWVIDIKAAIERIKEMIQNVE